VSALSQGGALPPAGDMAFDASAMRPIQDEEYDLSEMLPARAPSFMYVLGAAGGTAREAAEWWLSDAPHYFLRAPHTHYAWLEGYALALDDGKVYAEALRNVQDAARELGRALSPEDARWYALRRALDLRLLEIERAGKTEWRRNECSALDRAIDEARSAEAVRGGTRNRRGHSPRRSQSNPSPACFFIILLGNVL
jgi:hypothetical protein